MRPWMVHCPVWLHQTSHVLSLSATRGGVDETLSPEPERADQTPAFTGLRARPGNRSVRSGVSPEAYFITKTDAISAHVCGHFVFFFSPWDSDPHDMTGRDRVAPPEVIAPAAAVHPRMSQMKIDAPRVASQSLKLPTQAHSRDYALHRPRRAAPQPLPADIPESLSAVTASAPLSPNAS